MDREQVAQGGGLLLAREFGLRRVEERAFAFLHLEEPALPRLEECDRAVTSTNAASAAIAK
ncbi:MAG: hypothetical protein IPL06_19560 [Betaproteobacteria bacterium]|nr:hypothetical protein [Betaproteobacteria bacterium]